MTYCAGPTGSIPISPPTSPITGNKFAVRGFDKVINVWGADHHGHVARLKGAMDALGLDGEHRLDIVLMQLVKLVRDGEVVRMSKRTGKAISLTDLLDGYIARHYNQVSDFGKFADPPGGQVPGDGGPVLVVETGDMVGWVLAAVLLREFAVSGMRLIAVENGPGHRRRLVRQGKRPPAPWCASA